MRAARRRRLFAVLGLLLTVSVSAPLSAVQAAAASDAPRTGRERIPEYGVEPGDRNALGNRRTWAVQPSGPNGPGVRPTFRYSAAPGDTVVDWVGVSNFSRKPLRLAVYATDAFTSHEGAFSLLTGERAPVDVGSWIALRSRAVTVPARSRLDIPFELRVPDDATPGDHTGGVVAALRSERRASNGSVVAVDQRIAARVYLRVDGPLRPALTVTGLTADYHQSRNPVSGSVTLRWTVRNDGNVRLSGAQRVLLSPPIGGDRTATLPALPELLPGSSASFSQRVSSVRPLGRLTAALTVRGRLVDPDLGDVDAVVVQATRASGFWALPLALLAGLITLIALLCGVLLRRRALRRRPPPPAVITLPDRGATSVTVQEPSSAHSPV